MKKEICVTIFCCICLIRLAKGIDVMSFYSKLNDAEYCHLIKKNYILSNKKYKDLISNFDSLFFKSSRPYLALEASLILKDSNSVIHYFIQSKRHGFDTLVVIDSRYKNAKVIQNLLADFKKSNIWKVAIRDCYSSLVEAKPEYYPQHLQELLFEMSFLNGVDQGIRELYRNSNSDTSLIDDVNRIDKRNFKVFIKTLQSVNSIVDRTVLIKKSMTLILHTFFVCEVGNKIDSSDFNYLSSCLLESLNNALITNRLYALIIDRAYAHRCKIKCEGEQIYGTYFIYNSSSDSAKAFLPALFNFSNIDNRRSSIGLPTLQIDAEFYGITLPESYILNKDLICK